MAKRVLITMPATAQIEYVKLLVVADLRLDLAFYMVNDIIEVTTREAAALLKEYPEHFQRVTE
jgi:hypothetical protein